MYSPAESSHHVAFGYAENVSVFLGDFGLLIPMLNDTSAHTLYVLTFEEKMQVLVKNILLACFKTYVDLILSIRIDDNFPIVISSNSAT